MVHGVQEEVFQKGGNFDSYGKVVATFIRPPRLRTQNAADTMWPCTDIAIFALHSQATCTRTSSGEDGSP